MRSQGKRLRCKQSQMPCNLVNFISLNGESEVGWGQQRGMTQERKKKKKKGKERARERKKGVKLNNFSGRGKECRGRESVTTTMDSAMSSDVR